jgi:DNA-binding MarR family transcriptional regulator
LLVAERTSGPSLLFELFAASQRVRSLLVDVMADAGLTPDEYAVYSVLVDRGPTTPSQMASAVGMPPTTMSHYVRAMLERRHVQRRPNPDDGRSVLLALTRSGRNAHSRAAAAFEEANIRFLDQLQRSDREVRSVLQAMNSAAERASTSLAYDALRTAG